MKKRKLVSTAVAGALVAAQMTMPAMAATGTVNATITTKNAVIRVQVPTNLEVAVDEFETMGDGSQIYSEEFNIKNFSSVPVYVKTTSTVTPGSNTVLKDTKAGVVTDASGKGNAWLAVAAQTAANSYGTISGLAETSANVQTVNPTGGKAEQEFYLDKSAGATAYKMADATTAVPSIAYVGEYIPLTALGVAASGGTPDNSSTFFNDDADDASAAAGSTNNDILRGLLATSDIYYVATANIGEGVTMSKLTSADAATATYSSSNTYYKPGTATATMSAGSVYVYAEQSAVGGQTAFRFIGKLSTGKTGGWGTGDFSAIQIDYDITGVQGSAYDVAKNDCTYGLYVAPEACAITTSKTVTATAGSDLDFTVELGAGSQGASGIASVISSAYEDYDLLNSDGDVVFEDGKLTFPAETIDYLRSDSTVTWPITVEVTFEMNDSTAEAVVETLTLNR